MSFEIVRELTMASNMLSQRVCNQQHIKTFGESFVFINSLYSLAKHESGFLDLHFRNRVFSSVTLALASASFCLISSTAPLSFELAALVFARALQDDDARTAELAARPFPLGSFGFGSSASKNGSSWTAGLSSLSVSSSELSELSTFQDKALLL